MSRFLHITIAIVLFAGASLAQNSTDCSNIKDIKEMPRNPRERGIDKAYDKIIAKGEKAVPCLIEQITNTTITHDPRCPTINTETKIGDVAFFVLVDLLEFEFTEFFPDDVKANYKVNGVYAYEAYVEKAGARFELQHKVRKWYAERKKNK